MHESLHIRAGSRADLPVLETMIFEAFHWDPQAPRPDMESFRQHPEFQKLLNQWGQREGDTAVVAEMDGQPIGAAWYRFWTPECHSYGFVNTVTPEVAIGVDVNFRSRGVGRALMEALIDRASDGLVGALSLSVARDNFALGLYRSLGFRPVGSMGTSLTLVLEFEPRCSGDAS